MQNNFAKLKLSPYAKNFFAKLEWSPDAEKNFAKLKCPRLWEKEKNFFCNITSLIKILQHIISN